MKNKFFLLKKFQIYLENKIKKIKLLNYFLHSNILKNNL